MKLKNPINGTHSNIKMNKGDMYEIIRQNVIEKSVLDVGCVDNKGIFYC